MFGCGTTLRADPVLISLVGVVADVAVIAVFSCRLEELLMLQWLGDATFTLNGFQSDFRQKLEFG